MSNPRQKTQTTGHRYALKRLSSYLDGQLSDQERARLQAHLDACPDCRDELRTLRWTQDLARQMPAMPVPRSFIVREADLETRPLVQPQFRLARSLAGLQTAAAIVAVLLVLVVAGDVFVGRGLPIGQMGRNFSIEAADPKAATTALASVPENMDTSSTDEQPNPTPETQRIMSLAAPTETVTETATGVAAKTMAEPTTSPTIEPSPTLSARPTRTPTQAGNTAQATSNETPTRSPTETATTAPTYTPTAAPTQTAAPPSTATLAPTSEPQQWVAVPDPATQEEAKIEGQGLVEQRDVSSALGRQSWRIVQVGLGVVLLCLLIVIVWLRRQGRFG